MLFLTISLSSYVCSGPQVYITTSHFFIARSGGEEAMLDWGGGGRELRLLCGFNQYTLFQNRDNSGLLGTLYIVA